MNNFGEWYNVEHMSLDDFDFDECYEFIEKNYVQGSYEFVIDNYCSVKNIFLTRKEFDTVMQVMSQIIGLKHNG